jgi:hypothetical protein
MEVSGQFPMPTTSILVQQHTTPIQQMLIRPQSRYGRSGEVKNVLPLLGIELHIVSCPACSLDTVKNITLLAPVFPF